MLLRRSLSVKMSVALFLVTMSTTAYFEGGAVWHQRFGQQQPGLVIERIFDDAAEASMAILAEPPLWRTWPHKAVVRAPGRQCAWARFTPPRTAGMQPPVNGSICLRNETDLLCDEVRRIGYWPECADLPGLYTRAVATLTAEIQRRPRVAFPRGPLLFVDAGANVGACTLHMLLATSAKVVSFEPSGANLFHASSSILGVRAQAPAARLRLYPIALGASNDSGLLYSAVGNAGHSVVNSKAAFYAPKGHEVAQRILVRTLDDVLWPEPSRYKAPPPTVVLLKLDVEGFECKVLHGMRRLLQAHAVRFIKTEVFDYGLRQQGCSGVELQQLLAGAGFRLYPTDPTDPGVHPAQTSLNPDVLLGTLTGDPYNLYCVQGQPYPRFTDLRRMRTATGSGLL